MTAYKMKDRATGRITNKNVYILVTGVGSGGGGGGGFQGGMCPHFFYWGAMVCLCPPPHF